jgi:hypothetical protein
MRWYLLSSVVVATLIGNSDARAREKFSPTDLIGQQVYPVGESASICAITNVGYTASGDVRFYECNGGPSLLRPLRLDASRVSAIFGNKGLIRVEVTLPREQVDALLGRTPKIQ